MTKLAHQGLAAFEYLGFAILDLKDAVGVLHGCLSALHMWQPIVFNHLDLFDGVRGGSRVKW